MGLIAPHLSPIEVAELATVLLLPSSARAMRN